MCAAFSKNEPLIGGAYGPRLCELLDNAKSEICVLMFEWKWYGSDPSNPMQLVNQSFVRAVRRGVSVRALTSGRVAVAKLREVGIDAKEANSSRLLHSKLIVVDRRFVLIGSHNLTYSALSSNFELSSLIDDEDLASSLLKQFENIWQL